MHDGLVLVFGVPLRPVAAHYFNLDFVRDLRIEPKQTKKFKRARRSVAQKMLAKPVERNSNSLIDVQDL